MELARGVSFRRRACEIRQKFRVALCEEPIEGEREKDKGERRKAKKRDEREREGMGA